MTVWEFEKPIIELETTIEELKKFALEKEVDLSSETVKLEEKLSLLKKEIYSNLTPWQKVQIARHPDRPNVGDYIKLIMKDFVGLGGDRLFGEDKAVICGFARLENKKLAVIGHQKGKG
ncbi:MAG: acetyl-CoA carboxylase carboxyl transferase subunit alpha, partial [Candidatus Omnitrophica bacterium]|nr:acetyl-CoA carboxylase carboxyl transferase subunit alpha [Candidatus Omnitrophota bacterium]MBD3269044.1 acetyl-CoA carboxylase carboxyl transferase subunit alpha [Candidatus Omnitrophota bacterium]